MAHSEIGRRGLLLVLSSPSGAGKTTITRLLVERDGNLGVSISATTRTPRANEIDGQHYHFVSEGRFDLFLSADAESPATLQYPLPPVEAMKVSHHGSADPGLPEVLKRLRPQVAAIEVGKDNPYGHPAAPTLAALRAAVPHVYRTDRDGTVRLTVDGDRLHVSTHG